MSIDDVETSKQIKPVSSPTDTYLYLSVYNKQYTVGDSLKVLYKTKNAPVEGFIYYLVKTNSVNKAVIVLILFYISI